MRHGDIREAAERFGATSETDLNLLVTGFGPFAAAQDNPSARLAETCEAPYRVLEVAFAAVDAFWDDPGDADAILLMGVAAGTRRMRAEWIGRNYVGRAHDVRDEGRPGPIAAGAPEVLASTLWPRVQTRIHPSVDAGSYLCNYILFEGLRRWPERRIGFLHVPHFSAIPECIQRAKVQALVRELQGWS